MKEIPVIVFVCEHGSAKSIIAAAHLNRLAFERHLDLRAVARGTNPDATIPPHVIEGLRREKLTPDGDKPEQLSPHDLEGAVRLVTFCELSNEYHGRTPVEQWTDVPPVSQNYERARDVIAQHVSGLVDKLKLDKR